MNDSTSETPPRQCSNKENCVHPDGCWQPNDAGHFYQRKSAGAQCIACHRVRSNNWKRDNADRASEYGRQYRETNRETNREYARNYYHEHQTERREYDRKRRVENRETLLQIRREWYHANIEQERERQHAWRSANREKTRQAALNYYYNNLERKKAQAREWKRQNRERVKNYLKQWREKNREHIREYERAYAPRWRENNRLYVRVINRQRRARVRSLPSTFTTEQWQQCLAYWHNTCAYCGAQQDFWHTIEQDHFIPTVAQGGYTADNILPACKSCNSSKNDTAAETWLKTKFSPSQAAKILARIEAYFAWVREQDNHSETS